MYHSHLLINIGDNPDRPDWNICRRWLRNLYRVHQRLCMAFPILAPAVDDWAGREKAYCAPFAPAKFPKSRDLPAEDSFDASDCEEHQPRQVHAPRRADDGFLFRIDYPPDPLGRPGRRPVIIVQSSDEPDWNYAFGLTPDKYGDRWRPVGNAGFLLAAPPSTPKEVAIQVDGDALVLDSPANKHRLRGGDQVRFRLRANPVCKRDGKRHRPRIDDKLFQAGGVVRERAFVQAHRDWLIGKLGAAAETVDVPDDGIVTGWSYAWRTKHEPQPNLRMQFWSVLFEGTFVLHDPATLCELLINGIGAAKAFGFGLLSVAPARH